MTTKQQQIEKDNQSEFNRVQRALQEKSKEVTHLKKMLSDTRRQLATSFNQADRTQTMNSTITLFNLVMKMKKLLLKTQT